MTVRMKIHHRDTEDAEKRTPVSPRSAAAYYRPPTADCRHPAATTPATLCLTVAPPSEMARAIGVKVERRPPLDIPGVQLFAEYCPKPATIIVYTDDYERAVAHELYHHLGGRDEREAREFAEALLAMANGKEVR